MSIITKADFIKATGTGQIPGLAALLMRILKIDAFNNLIKEAENLTGVAFASYLLEILGVTIAIDEADLANIPELGAFIAVANHPYGAIESLALLSVLAKHRPDTLFMGNFLLKRIPNLAEHIIAVNPFENVQDASSISGLKTTLKTLKGGAPVAIFPAGEVSAFEFKKRGITDRQWHPVVGKIISKANVPVLPVYFYGHNGLGFSLLRFIHPSLQTAMLPSELFNKKGITLRMRIGACALPASAPQQDNSASVLTYFRNKTYGLATE